MCNICFCLFTHSCEETENCGCSRLCLFFCFFPWLREVHVAPKPLSYHTFFFLLNTTVLLHRFSLTLSFCAFQLFICLHPAFASDTVGTELWARKKKPTETFAFFLFTRSTSALLGDGSQSFVSLSRCLTKLTLHFASCGHEQHCRNTAVWGNGQVLKRRSCCVCG